MVDERKQVNILPMASMLYTLHMEKKCLPALAALRQREICSTVNRKWNPGSWKFWKTNPELSDLVRLMKAYPYFAHKVMEVVSPFP